MEVEYENGTVTVRFSAPATLEMDRDTLDFTAYPDCAHIRLEFRGVKLISSMVLGSIMRMMDRYRTQCSVRLLNLEPEMRNLLTRTGLGSWLTMVEHTER